MTQSAATPQNGVPQTAKGRLELFVKNLANVVSKELSEEQCAMLERSPVLIVLDKGLGFIKHVGRVEGSLREMTVVEFLQIALRAAGVGNVSPDMTVVDAIKLLQNLVTKPR